MSGYVSPPLDTSPSTIIEDCLDYVETQIPGWQAAPGGIDTLIIEANAEPAAEANDLASAALTAVFRYFGKLTNLPVIDASPATVTVRFTVQDAAGYTIDGGSTVGLRDTDGELWGFALVDDLVIAVAATSGLATCVADVSGSGANALTGTAELVDVPAFVTAAAATSVSANGVDAEEDQVYLDRLSETLTLLSPRPILPADFAIMARNVSGVWRATAVDLLKPGPPYTGTAESSPVAESITVAVTDAAGADPGSTVRAAVLAQLQAEREQNANVYVVAAQYATIDVSVTVKAMPGEDVTALQADVVTRLSEYLSPVSWGSPDRGSQRVWLNDPVVRASGLYNAIENVAGVRYASGLTFGLHGGAMAATDVTMGSGSLIPALPIAGTLTVTVTA